MPEGFGCCRHQTHHTKVYERTNDEITLDEVEHILVYVNQVWPLQSQPCPAAMTLDIVGG